MADVDLREAVVRDVRKVVVRTLREVGRSLKDDAEAIVGRVLSDLAVHEDPRTFEGLSELARVAAIGVAAESVKGVDRDIETRAVPVPAATVPTPSLPSYAPKVGDRVRSADGRVGVIKCRTSPSIFPGWDILPLGKRDPMWALSRVPDDRMDGWTYEGPATAAERAAAGLPVDEAKPTPPYPVDGVGRPLWVRVTGIPTVYRGSRLMPLTVGKVYEVRSWDSAGFPLVSGDDGAGWYLALPGDKTLDHYASWEACAAPVLKFEIPEVRPGRPQSKSDAKPEPAFTEGEAADLMRALVTAGRNGMLLAPVVNEAVRARGAK